MFYNAILDDAVAVGACAPWSTLPLIMLALGVLSFVGIIYLARYFAKKENDKAINIIIFVYGLIFFGLELYHQIGRYFELGHYDWSSFPYQFCTMPIYLGFIVPFIKKGTIKDSFLFYFGLFCLISGTFPLLFGQDALCRWETMFEAARSFIWHILIVQESIFVISYLHIGKDFKTEWKPLVGSMVIFFGFMCGAQILNVIIHYGAGGIDWAAPADPGYKNGAYAQSVKYADPDVAGCFYISPWMQSPMPVYKLVWVSVGWVFNWFLYYVTYSLLVAIIYFIFYGSRIGIDRLNKLIKSKKANKEQVQE